MVKELQDKHLRKVLIIAYSFPPMGGGRVRRVLKFSKYLKDFGWTPVILTAKRHVASVFDEGLLNELPEDIKIFKALCLEPTSHLKDRIRRSNNSKRSFFSFRGIIARFFTKFKWWVFVPDTRIGWIPFAVMSGLRIVRREKINVIMVIGEPYSSFFSGAILKLLTKKPLILDFRDEWAQLNRYFFPDKPSLVKVIERRMERFVIGCADKVISVTDPIINTFKNTYPCWADKFICISNGFDPDDFRGLSAQRTPDGKFIITYAGSLYALRSPASFLNALEWLHRHEPAIAEDIRVVFIGTAEPDILRLLDGYREKGWVVFADFMKYQEVVRCLSQSDLLLYIQDQAQIGGRFLPAKLFDYIGVKRPILALAGDGVVKDTIERLNCGLTVSADDAVQIALALKQLYGLHKSGKLVFQINEDYQMQFNRRELTRKLAGILSSESNK